MLKDQYNQGMSINDNEAIAWLESFAQTNPSLQDSIIVFKRYYQECLKELAKKELRQEELENAESRIKTIQSYLQNPDFSEKVKVGNKSSNSLPLLTEEEINKIINTKFGNSNKENLETMMKILETSKEKTQQIIRKIDRFYNMQLKYGHTARITYIAAANIEKLNITNDLVIKVILTSALMHDIGRFYQAANYNDLGDPISEEKIVINEDGEMVNLRVDHAVAGYYYSLMDLYRLSALGKAEYKDLLIHSIVAVIVRYHQVSNELLQEFDTKITDFEFSEDIEHQLIDFLVDSYSQAELITQAQSKYMYDKKHIRFIDRVIHKIVEENKLGIQSQLENAFINVEYNEEDREEQIRTITSVLEESHKNLEERLISYYQNPNSQEGKDILITIVKEIKDAINKSKGFNVISEERIEEIIKSLPDYDIAEAIDKRFTRESIPPEIRKIFSIALSCTMDADKIDILNQRAAGIYNVKYNPAQLSIYPVETMSLVELLNEYFAFKIDPDNLYIDNRIISIISNNLKAKEKDWFKRQGIDLEELLNQTKDKEIKIEKEHPLYNLIVKTPWKEIIANDKKHKKDYLNKNIPTLKVPREIFDENIANKSEKEKLKAYKRLLIVPEQIELFQKSASFDREVGKLHSNWNNYSQEHIVWNSISALIWQLNQFIMVNIRSRASIDFIRETKIIENIYNRYSEAPIIQNILKPYLAYILMFTDVLKALKTNGHDVTTVAKDETYQEVLTYDSKLLRKIREIVANQEIFNNNIIINYMAYLEDNNKPYTINPATESVGFKL